MTGDVPKDTEFMSGRIQNHGPEGSIGKVYPDEMDPATTAVLKTDLPSLKRLLRNARDSLEFRETARPPRRLGQCRDLKAEAGQSCSCQQDHLKESEF